MKRLPAKHMVAADNGCIVWTGALSTAQYGRARVDGRMQQAHRVAYEDVIGPIPDGLVIDHLCRNTRCVNPLHMEPVTIAENVRRGYEAKNQTHCKRGHDLNNARIGKQGNRHCRECETARRRDATDESKAKRRAYAAAWARRKRAEGRAATEPGRVSVKVDVKGNQP